MKSRDNANELALGLWLVARLGGTQAFCMYTGERLTSITPNLGPQLPYWLRFCWALEPIDVSSS